MKDSILNLKDFIKELNKEQRFDKIQRKTERFPENLKRTKSAWEAAEDVRSRTEELRMLYKIYEIWREKEVSADPNFDKWVHEWGRKNRYDDLFEEVWQKFVKSSKQEA